MSKSTKIIEANYSFILDTCRKILGRHNTASHDLAHDIVEKILNMKSKQLDKLRQKPKAYIYTMVSNQFLNEKKHDKIVTKVNSELLYLCDKCVMPTHLEELTGNNTTQTAAQIAKIKKLTDFERMVLAATIKYPTPSLLSRGIGVHRTRATAWINNLKLKLNE